MRGMRLSSMPRSNAVWTGFNVARMCGMRSNVQPTWDQEDHLPRRPHARDEAVGAGDNAAYSQNLQRRPHARDETDLAVVKPRKTILQRRPHARDETRAKACSFASFWSFNVARMR